MLRISDPHSSRHGGQSSCHPSSQIAGLPETHGQTAGGRAGGPRPIRSRLRGRCTPYTLPQARSSPLRSLVLLHLLTFTRQVARVKDILTSPSQLESTSLIFTYGLDLFQTRVSPSSTFDLLSEDFNRAQLGVTVVALALAIMATGPLVRKRALMRQWY